MVVPVFQHQFLKKLSLQQAGRHGTETLVRTYILFYKHRGWGEEEGGEGEEGEGERGGAGMGRRGERREKHRAPVQESEIAPMRQQDSK